MSLIYSIGENCYTLSNIELHKLFLDLLIDSIVLMENGHCRFYSFRIKLNLYSRSTITISIIVGWQEQNTSVEIMLRVGTHARISCNVQKRATKAGTRSLIWHLPQLV